jgi:hypothetical protein
MKSELDAKVENVRKEHKLALKELEKQHVAERRSRQ